MSVESSLLNRHANHYLDPNVKISREELSALLALAGKAPSAFNTQPWRVVVLTEQAAKEKLFPIAFNQQQVLDASAVLMILADREAIKQPLVEKLNETQVKQGFLPEELKQQMIGMTVAFYQGLEQQKIMNFLGLDIGLFAMSFMLAAEEKGWNTSPMIGYNSQALRSTFSISERYEDVLLIAIGKKVKEPHQSYRYDVNEFVTWDEIPTA